MRPGYLNVGDDSWPRKEWVQARTQGDEKRRRHPMHRVAVLFADPDKDDPAYRRWIMGCVKCRWVGADAAPEEVARKLEKPLPPVG